MAEVAGRSGRLADNIFESLSWGLKWNQMRCWQYRYTVIYISIHAVEGDFMNELAA